MTAAAGIAFLHTLLGPDHYLPFAGMARAFGWPRRRLVAVTLLCGAGHVLGSLLLGVLGIAAGLALAKLKLMETLRGQVAAWALMAFGLAYFTWGMRHALRRRPHEHLHAHADGTIHRHVHTHEDAHLHPHPPAAQAPAASTGAWLLFSIFLLGPCEPLIPLLMYPASQGSWAGVVLVAAIFSLTTLTTMLAAVLLCDSGLRQFRLAALEPYGHALAGATVACCGVAIKLFSV
jgi:sulfite exporter TauE/SafE